MRYLIPVIIYLIIPNKVHACYSDWECSNMCNIDKIGICITDPYTAMGRCVCVRDNNKCEQSEEERTELNNLIQGLR